MKVESLQIGKVRETDGLTSSIWKTPVSGALVVGPLGADGDEQADTSVHGGVHMALCCYPAEHFEFWKVDQGLDMAPGAFGENLTLSGLLEEDVCIGDLYQIGSVRVEVSQPRQPCFKLAKRWKCKTLALRVQQTGFSGWYFRVLQGGELQSSMEVKLVERPFPEWTIQEVNRLMYHEKEDAETARMLGKCEALSPSWQRVLANR